MADNGIADPSGLSGDHLFRRIAASASALAVLIPVASAASLALPAAASAAAVPIFGPVQVVQVGPAPEATAIGDVTGDGRADVLVGVMTPGGSAAATNDLLVFAQRADGSLAPPVRYATGLSSGDRAGMGVAVLEANGDGRRDVAMATRSGVQIMVQTTAGTLAMRQLVAGTTGAEFIAAADMDRDGDTDLVVNGEAGTALLRQGPAGVFAASPVGSGWALGLAVGDVDGDGWPDIAICGRSTYVTVYHHATIGWRVTTHTPVTGYWTVPEGIEIADVTGDRRADVAVTISGNGPGALLNVFRQTATGGLAAPVVYPTPDVPVPVKAADLNGDARKDLVIVHAGWKLVSTLVQRSDGTLTAPVSYPIPYGSSYSQGLALGDFNGDKRIDAALADRQYNLFLLYNVYRAGSALTSATSASTVTYGSTVTVSGRLTSTDTGNGVGGAPVQLYGRRKGTTTWLLLGTATSSSTGALAISHRPTWTLDYRWSYAGSATHGSSVSAARAVGVGTKVSATLSRTSVALGGSVTLSGTVAPTHAGQAVYLQRLVNGSWSTVAGRTLSSTSTYGFTIKPSSRASYYYRVYKPADVDHLAGYSGTRSFSIY